MPNTATKRINQTRYGSTEFARRVRAFHSLGSHIANLAGVSRTHVSSVICGRSRSRRLMKIAMRELAKAQAGKLDIGRAA